MRTWITGVILVLATWAITPAAWAAERVALIIGNGAYSDLRGLPNAGNDARLLHRTLTDMGFDAGPRPLIDLSKSALERALRDFRTKASGAEVAVLYYAGHGMEAAGNNYLIPTDAELASDGDAEYEAIPLSTVMRTLAGVKNLGLVLLDACRDDPFRNSSRSVFRSSERPTFRNIVRAGSLNKVAVGFAAQLGALASDGVGRNSPYAKALAEHLPTAGVGFAEALSRVGQTVERTTRQKQSPHLDARLALLSGNPLVEGVKPEPIRPKPEPVIVPNTGNAPVLVVDSSGGGDHRTITSAISAAKAGTRIEIRPGRYSGPLSVYKPLELVGIGARSTIVVENKDANVIFWKAESGRIANLTIRQLGSTDEKYHSGVFFDDGSAVLENNVLTSKSTAVVYVRGSSAAPTIRRNTIRDGVFAGILMDKGAGGRIEGNEIHGNSNGQIELRGGSNVVVVNNTIRDGEMNGISVYGEATGLIEGNEIYRNGYAGISVKTGANPVIRDNEIRETKFSGILVHDDGLGRIEKNNIHSNEASGIEIRTGGNPLVQDNKITGNTWRGVRIYNSGKGRIFDNDLRGNKKSPIAVEDTAGSVEQRGNKL